MSGQRRSNRSLWRAAYIFVCKHLVQNKIPFFFCNNYFKLDIHLLCSSMTEKSSYTLGLLTKVLSVHLFILFNELNTVVLTKWLFKYCFALKHLETCRFIYKITQPGKILLA